MRTVNFITYSNEKPNTEKCIIQGVDNYINYLYLATDNNYIIFYSVEKLTKEDMLSIMMDDSYLDKYF
jgi:hypothetical protein